MREGLGKRGCAPSPENFGLLSGKWSVLCILCAIFEVNLFLMIKNGFTSKVAYRLKILPSFLGVGQ